MSELMQVIRNEYEEGIKTVEQIADQYGICTRKAYYLLHRAGCKLTGKRRVPVTDDFRAKMSAINKGRSVSNETRRKIGIANSCDYNGLNGYGHTKQHNRGYVLAYAPHHPKAHKDGYVMLHTIIMERFLGRYLEDDEVVHHINHDRQDNRIENLMLMNAHEHQSMHMIELHSKRRNDLSNAR